MADVIKHDSMEDAVKSFAEGFTKAEKTKKWLAAVWGVVDGKVVMIRRTTHDFPTGDFDVCLSQLKESLDGEKNDLKPEEPDALPKADFYKFVKEGEEKGTLEKVAEASGVGEPCKVNPDFLVDPEKHSEAKIEDNQAFAVKEEPPLTTFGETKIEEETPEPCEE